MVVDVQCGAKVVWRGQRPLHDGVPHRLPGVITDVLAKV